MLLHFLCYYFLLSYYPVIICKSRWTVISFLRFFIFIHTALTSDPGPQADNECPAECSCPPSPQPCPPGVSWVTDHCGCCKVCAKQFNEDCSATKPCDHIKGLRCHLGAGGDPERGLCRGERRRIFKLFKLFISYQHKDIITQQPI